MKQKRKFFLLTDLIRRWENDLQTITGVASSAVYGGIPDKMFVHYDICESYITGDILLFSG